MFPFLLHGQKLLGVTGRHRLFHVRERLPEFLAGMRYQSFKGALVGHRDNPTLNSTAQQLARQALLLCVVAVMPLGNARHPDAGRDEHPVVRRRKTRDCVAS